MAKKKTHDEFVSEVYTLVNDEYSILSEYVNNSTKVLFKHKTCCKSFEMKPTNFLSNGQRCPHCNSNFNKIKIEDIRRLFEERNLTLLSDTYKNHKSKLLYRCNTCQNEHSVSYMDLKLKNNGCPYCAGNKKLTFDDIKTKINNVEGYLVVSTNSEFKNVHSKLTIKHNCGLTYKNSFNNFRNGQRCPFCSRRSASGGMSKNVVKIIEYFIEHNIKFEIEKKFDDLKIKSRHARFDFYLSDLNLLIEYQGSQHFIPSGRFSAEKVKSIQESDRLKKEYANNNSIDIEYILYNEETIPSLEKILLKYNKI